MEVKYYKVDSYHDDLPEQISDKRFLDRKKLIELVLKYYKPKFIKPNIKYFGSVVIDGEYKDSCFSIDWFNYDTKEKLYTVKHNESVVAFRIVYEEKQIEYDIVNEGVRFKVPLMIELFNYKIEHEAEVKESGKPYKPEIKREVIENVKRYPLQIIGANTQYPKYNIDNSKTAYMIEDLIYINKFVDEYID